MIGELKVDLPANQEIVPVLQKFDSNWSEWVDVQNVSGIKNKENIQLVIPTQPAVGKTISTINNLESSALDNIQTGLHSYMLLINVFDCSIYCMTHTHTN